MYTKGIWLDPPPVLWHRHLQSLGHQQPQQFRVIQNSQLTGRSRRQDAAYEPTGGLWQLLQVWLQVSAVLHLAPGTGNSRVRFVLEQQADCTPAPGCLQNAAAAAEQKAFPAGRQCDLVQQASHCQSGPIKILARDGPLAQRNGAAPVRQP